jgi:chromosome segregation ATPase
MMRPLTVGMFALGILLAAAPARAQEPAPSRPRAEELRRRVRERLAERVRQQLDLTDDQMRQLRSTVGKFGGRRRDMEARQRSLREALAGELRPGVGASRDSVARLTDELMELRVRYAESFREEQAELARYLDPVQRARIMVLRERLVERGREFRGRRPFMDRRVPPE